MQYEDGRNQSLTYEWGDSSGAFQMKSAWTGKTVFKLKPPPHAALISNLDRKTLRHSVRQLVNLAQLEHEVLTSTSSSNPNPLQRHKHRSRVDLLETFAGRAGLSFRAKSFGLKALGPIDFNTGYDLSKAEHQAHVDHLLDFYRPLFLVQGIDCTDWCLLQDNVNYIRRKILLLMRRAKARKLLKKIVDWCIKQSNAGRFFLIENFGWSLWFWSCRSCLAWVFHFAIQEPTVRWIPSTRWSARPSSSWAIVLMFWLGWRAVWALSNFANVSSWKARRPLCLSTTLMRWSKRCSLASSRLLWSWILNASWCQGLLNTQFG